MTTWYRAEAPPTVANVGPGFDALGLAVPAPGDVAWVRAALGQSSTLRVVGPPGGMPLEVDRNAATVAALRLRDLAGAEAGLDVVLQKRLPTGGSGLGSSGASAAAAVAAATAALGLEDPPEAWLLEAGAAGEEIACGAPHVDNVAPALFGGLVLLTPAGRAVRLTVPADLHVAVARPTNAEVPTAAARAAVPAHVATATAVAQASSLGALVHALHTDDLDLLSEVLIGRIAAPPRSPLVPAYAEVVSAALQAGALGASMSGSGPAIFAFCRRGQAADVAIAMTKAWCAAGHEAEVTHAGAAGGRGAMDAIRLDAPPGAG